MLLLRSPEPNTVERNCASTHANTESPYHGLPEAGWVGIGDQNRTRTIVGTLTQGMLRLYSGLLALGSGKAAAAHVQRLKQNRHEKN
jgi:hypothetical protein